MTECHQGFQNVLQKFVAASFNKNNIAIRGCEFSFLRDVYATNGWYLHFHKTYDHQNWIVCTSREVHSLESNEAAISDLITLRSHGFRKTLYLSLNKGYGPQTETARSVRDTKQVQINLKTNDDVINIRSHDFGKTL